MTLGEAVIVHGLPFALTGAALGLTYILQVSWGRRRG